MKTLACMDVCGEKCMACSFVAKGETDEDVMKQLDEHGKKAHPKEMEEMMKMMPKEQMMEMMKSKIREM